VNGTTHSLQESGTTQHVDICKAGLPQGNALTLISPPLL